MPYDSRVATVVVIASSIVFILPGTWGNSVTVVEYAQLPAGMAAWQRQALGTYRVCGPLSKFLYAALPHLAGVRVDHPPSFDSELLVRQEWATGGLFQSRCREEYQTIYRWSRLVPILVTMLGAVLICEWSTRLFGGWPGIVSLCAWCWMPPVLAHGSLVTSDVLAAVVLVLAARSFWSFLLRPGPLSAILVGLTLGLAASTKFTLLVLYPCWAVLLIARSLQHVGTTADWKGTPVPPMRLAALGLGAFLVSILVIDALYLFQDIGFRLEQFQPQSSLASGLDGMRAHLATGWLLKVPLPIPVEFLRGLDVQLADTERYQSAYMLGWSRPGGWWYWYAVAAVIKLPLPVLALFVLAVLRLRTTMRDPAPIRWAALCLLVPAVEAALAIAATTGTGTNAAFRYLIPSLALLCVWAGRAAREASRAMRIVIVVLLAWLALNAVFALPDHLGWRNEIGWAWERWSGRPALIGDSLDCGQDLARLGIWVGKHSDEGNTIVCVYGFGDGGPYGLKPPAARPTSDPGDRAAYLAVSENVLFSYAGGGAGVQFGKGHSSLSPEQREALLRINAFDRVGRSIRVYPLRGLPPGFFP
jgi:hypothetical protein